MLRANSRNQNPCFHASNSIKDDISKLYAKVLANRSPPYSVLGGVYDVLKATNGDMVAVTNEDALAAKKIFEDTEEIDIVPAAAVAVGGLMKMVDRGKIKKDETVLLNITGGGLERIIEDHPIQNLQPTIVTDDPVDAHLELMGILKGH